MYAAFMMDMRLIPFIDAPAVLPVAEVCAYFFRDRFKNVRFLVGNRNA